MVRKLARHLGRNAVAWVALFVALGGVSYAAIKIPANSVGTRQLRRGAVTNSKVRAHSLTARVFKKGTLLRGATGPRGATGATGATGPAGPTGPIGPSNATEAFHDASVSAPANTPTTILTLSGLPAGAYVISAKTVGTVPGATAANSTCTLTAGDQSDQSAAHIDNGNESQTQHTQLTQTFAGTGTATLSCNTDQPTNYTQTKIIAIKVGAESHTAA